jgi:release factor glutamine methyltransferase
MGERYKVTPDVLVPRPETEVLASTALERFPSDSAIRIADIGTGSGVLAGSLLKGYPNSSAVATDMSEKALAVARENLTSLSVINRVEFIRCSLLPESIAPFDLIAANLPYVSEADYLKAESEVKAEPKSALVPGPLGTELISALTRRAPAVLKPGGWLALEVGYNQSGEVEKMLHAVGLAEVFVEEDLAGIPRVVGGMLPK